MKGRKTSAKATKAASKVLRGGSGKSSRTSSAAVIHRYGRRAAYTEIGISRVTCVRCGEPASTQFQICADGNFHRPVCSPCDIEINRLILEYIGDPKIEEKMAKYIEEAK